MVVAVSTASFNGTKTYSVNFTEDGTFQEDLSWDMLFPIELTEEELSSRPAILEGQPVQARFMGDIYWFDATVTKVNGNGTFDLLYGDGDEEMNVVPEHIRIEQYTDGTIVEVSDTMDAGWYTPSPAPAPTSSK